jgi:serine phosphatase RsbU (regulator of sigma subunit)
VSDESIDVNAPIVAVVAGTEVPDRLTDSLDLPATSLDIAQFIAQRAAACVGADYSNIALLDATRTSLRLFHGPFLEPAMADRYTDVPIDAPFPIAAAVRSGKSVLLPDLDAYGEHFPEILADTIAAGVSATASLPLYRADGSPLGAIGFAWTAPRPFDLKLQSALEAVAMLCTETVEQAQRYDEEHQVIVGLQRRMLEDLPQVEGLAIAARYLPAGRSTLVGGDWYEGLRLTESRIAFVVGDVTGHGVTAAADMALIRGMITALLHSGVAIADVFSEVSAVLSQRRALVLASAALVVVDAAAETLTFATAGHPPPLILDSDGQVRPLDTANAPLLGLDKTFTTDRTLTSDTAPFPYGSQLIVFTDGLVERHDRPFATGMVQMATHLAALPSQLGPEDLINSLLDTLLGDTTPADDIALLVVEHLR